MGMQYHVNKCASGKPPFEKWWSSLTKFLLKICIAAVAVVAMGALPAFAYSESTSTAGATTCADCHGLMSRTQETSMVAPGRKGPHGGYTTGTQKCATCHVAHLSEGNNALLPAATIADTCETCHDGTGGGGVYGTIYARTSEEPSSTHSIGDDSFNASGTVTVPGGTSTGAELKTTFTGEGGSLTCTDCHNPHDSDTVEPFIGDRSRSTSDSSTGLASNRLLRRLTSKGTTSVADYGSDWCASCHKAAHPAGGSASFVHGVDGIADGFAYNKVIRRSQYDTITASAVATDLGGSNLGYIMTTDTAQPAPICQQCHEDARHVGDTVPLTVNSVTESFTVNTDGIGGGNPQFQNFPHEGRNSDMLIEHDDDLCLNCHPL